MTGAPRMLAIVGPTATGKSALALALADTAGGEIVNADALQVYRGLDVGTAKPTAAERALVPHHLIDIVDPRERFSAGEFARRARATLAEIAGRGRSALVVGGSGLYLRALWSGLAAIPPAPPELRAELAARLASDGLPALRRELAARDPESALRLGANDAQRIVRALEVALGTGRPLSAWHREAAPAGRLAMRKIGLTLPRAALYDRIAARVQQMVDRGWGDEVRRLRAAGIPRDAPAMQAIGYSDWNRHLDGEADLRTTVAAIVRATRRYAKRQETWFRREPGIEWRQASNPEAVQREIEPWLRSGEEGP